MLQHGLRILLGGHGGGQTQRFTATLPPPLAKSKRTLPPPGHSGGMCTIVRNLCHRLPPGEHHPGPSVLFHLILMTVSLGGAVTVPALWQGAQRHRINIMSHSRQLHPHFCPAPHSCSCTVPSQRIRLLPRSACRACPEEPSWALLSQKALVCTTAFVKEN